MQLKGKVFQCALKGWQNLLNNSNTLQLKRKMVKNLKYDLFLVELGFFLLLLKVFLVRGSNYAWDRIWH